mgnify:CR=1 FL=1|jgi:hypothetical protein
MPQYDNMLGKGFSAYAYSLVGLNAAGRVISREPAEVGLPQQMDMLRRIHIANALEMKKPPAQRVTYGFAEHDADASALAAKAVIANAMRRPLLLGYVPPKPDR